MFSRTDEFRYVLGSDCKLYKYYGPKCSYYSLDQFVYRKSSKLQKVDLNENTQLYMMDYNKNTYYLTQNRLICYNSEYILCVHEQARFNIKDNQLYLKYIHTGDFMQNKLNNYNKIKLRKLQRQLLQHTCYVYQVRPSQQAQSYFHQFSSLLQFVKTNINTLQSLRQQCDQNQILRTEHYQISYVKSLINISHLTFGFQKTSPSIKIVDGVIQQINEKIIQCKGLIIKALASIQSEQSLTFQLFKNGYLVIKEGSILIAQYKSHQCQVYHMRKTQLRVSDGKIQFIKKENTTFTHCLWLINCPPFKSYKVAERGFDWQQASIIAIQYENRGSFSPLIRVIEYNKKQTLFSFLEKYGIQYPHQTKYLKAALAELERTLFEFYGNPFTMSAIYSTERLPPKKQQHLDKLCASFDDRKIRQAMRSYSMAGNGWIKTVAGLEWFKENIEVVRFMSTVFG